jgi:hypothetical protein
MKYIIFFKTRSIYFTEIDLFYRQIYNFKNFFFVYNTVLIN